ncbi:MAG: hypothetical protein JRI41_00050 [Deltaproteobacteria bacterium]|nr:hypothetical protein [Deltaproteobacteria bacterium]RLB87773.1 MAG: hypothetical protein DRH10_08645 [Deltaproteobacteria bacterium]RLB94735.1 MAG: hypothetical protein DRH50_05945 [Deltaproteobacteria bacterium]RLC06918.1 MAG: hypothetical protein DRH43_12110 [Deltaproteobacteria bacterium]
MSELKRFGFVAAILAVLFAFAISTGCAHLKGVGISKEKSEAAATKEEKSPEPLYYDFEDVLVPSELKLDKKKSFVYHAPGFTAGVLVLSGRVEVSSLITFFENNMVKDNWRLLSVFKSPRTIIFFNKPNRSCIINITERQFKTEVEIWVAPTMEGQESTLLK